MALNKTVKATLKVISRKNIHMKKNYKLVRKVISITHPSVIRPFYQIWDQKIYYGEHEIPVRIFKKKNAPEKQPIIVFYHGGGWVTGDIESYTKVCTDLAKLTNHTIISVDYRLAPECRFPAAPEDCYHATKAVFEEAKRFFGVDEKEITLMGDSAGGNLSAVVSQMARDRGTFKVHKQILLYPATNNDFSEHSKFASIMENGSDYFLTRQRLCDYMDLYQSSPKDRENPYFAPLLAEDLSDQPKTMVITAQYDPLRDEGEAYGEKLREFGNDVTIYRMEDTLHGFFTHSLKLPYVKKCFNMINEFLNDMEIEECKRGMDNGKKTAKTESQTVAQS